MTKQQLTFRIGLYGILLSSLIGLIAFLFIFLESNISHHLWDIVQGNLLLSLVTCLTGGILIGLLKQRWGDYPKVAHHTISDLKTNLTVDYRPVFKNLTVALIILIFGAGVGPEAALLSSIVMLSVWQADKLRYLFFNQDTFISLSPSEKLKRMFHPTEYIETYQKSKASNHPKAKQINIVINTLFSLNGLFSFIFLMKLTEQPSFISHMGTSNWQLRELLIFIPLVLIGLIFGKLYLLLKKYMTKWFSFWQAAPLRKALIGSLAIFIISIFLPSLMFSGQTSLGMVPEKFFQYSFIFLLGVVFIKLIFLEICLNTGWIGGDIFPIVFASILLGFSFTHLFTSFDTIFIAAVVATSMSITILKSPLGIALFISLFFPLNILPLIFLVALIFKLVKKIEKKN